MDRVLVRSFRAHDLAERGLKDLARSRLDTTREVVFQPLGARFFEAREDVVRLANLFREDAFHSPAGNFARLTLRVEPQLAERLSVLEPRAVESRLEAAARDTILRELPRAQGAYVVRFEPSGREGLEPVAHVYLSSRRLDGGPLPALTKDDARRFEGVWNREVERAFNLTSEQAHGLERGPGQDRISALDPSAQHLQQEWSRASARLFAVYTDRLAGKATQKELTDAAGQARAARMAWSREAGPSVNLRDLASRQVFDVVRIRIEGGSRYFRGPLEAERRPLLETAASRAAGLPDEANRRLAVISWPAGRDLHATVYFNQRSQSHRPLGSIEPERLRAALEARLPDEIRRLAPSLDSAAGARADELGRIEARIQERTPQAERVVPGPERPDTPTSPRTPALVVTLDRDTESPSRTAAHAGDERLEGLSRLQTPERDWGNERVLSVRLEIPTGVEQLERMGLSPEEAKHVIQRAVDRAYPFLQQEGIRDNFLPSARGKALDVQVVVPERLGWTRDQLRSPQFQQRFLAGFHHAAAQVVLTRTGPALEPSLPGLVRGVSAVRQVPQVIRQFEQDPERAAKDLVRAAFNKLSETLPKPFRVMQELGRTVSRVRSRGE